jgi:molybdopterin/thiamine biosynthesis adenylyltransferase/rhodanese-related sulfurtransferase
VVWYYRCEEDKHKPSKGFVQGVGELFCESYILIYRVLGMWLRLTVLVPQDVPLSYEEIRRYGRHLIIPEVGMAGQRRLKASRVLVVGAGGLGSPISLYLAAAGVGHIGLVDFDRVDESNLQRQILYTTKDVKRPKLEAAKERLTAMNPHIEVETYETRLTSENALEIMKDYDVIVDGTDNFPTRYLVNDACVLLGKPNVYGSIFRFDGQVSVFDARRGPCYRCLYPEPPPPGLVPSCAEGGVLGVLPGVVGALQAMETLKLILGIGQPLIGRLLLFDGLHMSFTELKLRKDPNCKVCGPNPTVRELIDYEAFCGVTPSAGESSMHITPEELYRKLSSGEKVFLLDVREEVEYEICHLENAVLIPLSKLPERVNELSLTDEIVAYCHTGARSSMAVKLLRDLGFRRVRNLAGGIDAWAERIDPSMPRY